MNLLKEIMDEMLGRARDEHPEEWHMARVVSMDFKGIPVYNPETVQPGKVFFVTTLCRHKALIGDKEKTRAEFIEVHHGWSGDSFVDLPIETLEIDPEVLTRIQCSVCGDMSFLSPEKIAENARRPEMAGARSSKLMCDDCWKILSPVTESETARTLIKQMYDHGETCKVCGPIPRCATGLSLAQILKGVRLPGGGTMDTVADQLAKRKGFRKQIEGIEMMEMLRAAAAGL